MGTPTSGISADAKRPRGQVARGVMRPLPVYSAFFSDLPITPEEIQKVLAALGPVLAELFEE